MRKRCAPLVESTCLSQLSYIEPRGEFLLLEARLKIDRTLLFAEPPIYLPLHTYLLAGTKHRSVAVGSFRMMHIVRPFWPSL